MLLHYLKRALFISLLLVSLAYADTQVSKSPLETIDGKTFGFSDYHGKWLLINYWASWCPTCMAEIPALNDFYLAHKKEVVVLGVNYDDLSREELTTLTRKMAIQYPMVDTKSMTRMRVDNILGLPMTVLIDPQGHEHKPLLGEQSKESLERRTGLGMMSKNEIEVVEHE